MRTNRQGRGVRGQLVRNAEFGTRSVRLPHSPLPIPHSNLRSSQSKLRTAFTLLEVILALAILAGAMAAIGELVRGGLRNSREAADLTRAELIAQSIMAQIVTGAIYPEGANNVPVESYPGWVYSITIDSVGSQQSLLLARVTVQRDLPSSSRPAQFTLDRWIIDPDVIAQASLNQTNQSQSQSPSSPTPQQRSIGGGGGGP